ncbi:MAG: dipeptidase [Gammaproteobacteria bacterium]|nr:dipeptidase [Gammaproteobacteria bacterium]
MLRQIFHVATLLVLCACDTQSTSDIGVESKPEVLSLAHQYLIVDTHIDVPFRLFRNAADVSQATEDGDFDYPRAAAGGLDALFMSIFIPAAVDAEGNASVFADDLIDLVEGLVDAAPDKYQMASCTADIRAIRAAGKIAFPIGMENGGPLEGSFDNLDHFRQRGIRYITLAHSKSNHISDSSYDPHEPWAGLSPFGKTLIPAMNERGVMVDVSHISDNAFWQVLELTATPIIASHSSLRHFIPGFMRNMSDEMVAALQDNGGVIQINFGSGFLTADAHAYRGEAMQANLQFQEQNDLPEDDPAMRAFAASYALEHPYPYANMSDALDHIDRAVKLTGIDHVGLGSDYDGVGDTLPRGLKDVGAYPNLVTGLQARGYSNDDIEKILGGNIMRVWREVEAFAQAKGYPPLCRQANTPSVL